MAYGHENILAKHKNTIEFTKDKNLSLKGDCILGINSDFDKIMKYVCNFDKIIVKISCSGLEDSFTCEVNKDFDDENEIVFRKSDYKSNRTLGIRCDKGAKDINRKIVDHMKKGAIMEVEILEKTDE